MTLHVPTLMVTLILGYLMLTIQLGLAQDGLRGRAEIRRWTWGCWAFLAALLMLSARAVIPLGWSIVIGNGLMCLGLALFHQAFHHLLGEPIATRRLVWPLMASWLLLVWLVSWPPEWRAAGASWLLVAWLLPSAWRLAQRGRGMEREFRSLALTLWLAVLAFVFRGVHALRHPEQYADLFQNSLGQALTMLAAFMALLGAGFGFVLAVFERVARQMEQMASHDGLTGCLNRSTTDALLDHSLARAHREGHALAFVLLDLDHFKQVNDEHGHRTGDEVLRQFAQAARQRLRQADAMGRTGGEEFALVLPGTDAPGALRLVEDIRLATQALPVTDGQGHTVRVSVSAGVAVLGPGDVISAERLYGRADQALYEAKRGGRNRVVCYGDSNPRQAALIQ